MRTKKLVLAIFLMLPLLAHAGDDTYGTWIEVGAQKSIVVSGWSVGLETELRAQDEARWKMGAEVGYKLNKYLKFGAYYNFLYRRYPEETKIHYNKYNGKEDGYNINEQFWSPRHRAGVEVQATKKFWKWLRVSIRERYQYTYRMESDYDKTKYRFENIYDAGGNLLRQEWDDPEVEPDTKSAKSDNILRSRLKLSVDKKGLDWEPFVSTEVQNFLGVGEHMKVNKVRTIVGTSYKLNKSHELSMGYVFTCNVDDDEEGNSRHHALNIGYKFDF